MSPIIFVVVLGIAGGIAMAAWMIWASRRAGRTPVATGPIVETRVSTDMINMAHIRVAGVGGLGLVVMSIITAIYLPSVGQALGLGAALGIAMAGALIWTRRRRGPMPSSGTHSGAKTFLAIDSSTTTRESLRNDDASVPPHEGRSIVATA